MKNVKLPNKPSKLLKLALADLSKVQRSKKYKIDMGDWHQPYGFGDGDQFGDSDKEAFCSVCLAGSVLAKTLKLDKMTNYDPYFDANKDLNPKLYAINELRVGDVISAFEELNINDIEVAEKLNRKMPPFKGEGKRFKKAARKLIKDLEKAGY